MNKAWQRQATNVFQCKWCWCLHWCQWKCEIIFHPNKTNLGEFNRQKYLSKIIRITLNGKNHLIDSIQQLEQCWTQPSLMLMQMWSILCVLPLWAMESNRIEHLLHHRTWHHIKRPCKILIDMKIISLVCSSWKLFHLNWSNRYWCDDAVLTANYIQWWIFVSYSRKWVLPIWISNVEYAQKVKVLLTKMSLTMTNILLH